MSAGTASRRRSSPETTPIAPVLDQAFGGRGSFRNVDASSPHVYIGEIEMTAALDPVPGRDQEGRRWTGAQLLVRIYSEPVGLLNLDVPSEGLSVAALAAGLDRQLGERIRTRLAGFRPDGTGALPVTGLSSAQPSPFLEGRRSALVDPAEVTVIICTRNRPDQLRLALRSLRCQEYPAFRVLVVDNAPPDDRTRQVASELSAEVDLSYVVEMRPGLSWARNRGIESTSTELIAWLDDDEQADRWWLAELSRAFRDHPEAGCVSGIILPAEIEAPAQVWFEGYGGHHKGRGFDPLSFSPATRKIQSPLYPRPPFGTGGNMAFRRQAIDRIGRFNTALGAGTVAMGAEDTAAISELLYAGGTVYYHPAAVVWHTHRREVDGLRNVMRGYGRGLGAFYLSILLRHPQAIGELLRLSPQALRDMGGPSDMRGASEPAPSDGLEASLQREVRRGLLEGIPLYLLACWRARRLAGTEM